MTNSKITCGHSEIVSNEKQLNVDGKSRRHPRSLAVSRRTAQRRVAEFVELFFQHGDEPVFLIAVMAGDE